nr:unnamed protein product [Spirometra erinaceieuropaei]
MQTREINATLLAFENSGPISAINRRLVRARETALARFYGLPKLQNQDVPLRPIVSLKGTSTYGLAKWLFLRRLKFLTSDTDTTIQTAESEKQASATRAQVAEEKLEKAEALIKQLTVECAKYKNDCQVVAQLLHTNPDNFLQPNSDLGEHGLEASSGCGGKVERTPSGYTKPLLDKQDVESPQYILPTFPPIALPPESSLFVHRQKVFTDSAVSASNVETPATSKMGGVFQI